MVEEAFLPEQDGHKVAYYRYGNPGGPVIVSFHGGPGSKSKPKHAQRFDLEKYQVILFDQRGCGNSTPLGELEDNDTDRLIADTERLRRHLKIDSWFASGASWGSTMALLYAIKHPKSVSGLLLSSVYLADQSTRDWAMGPEGVTRIVPDVQQKREQFFKKYKINYQTQYADILKAIDSAPLKEQQEITAKVFDWEGNLFSTLSNPSYQNPEDISQEDIASVRIFMHYEMNNDYRPDNYILDNTTALSKTPTIIVHGRYDILCTIDQAYELDAKLENSELVIAGSSGHKLTAEGETIQKMAFDRFLEKHTAQ